MDQLRSYITEHWFAIVVPVTTFVLVFIGLMWVRTWAYRGMERQLKRSKEPLEGVLVQAIRLPSILWCLIISSYLAVASSHVPADGKIIAGKAFWSIFVISVTISILYIVRGLVEAYGSRLKLPWHTQALGKNIARVSVIVVAVLVVLGIWGAPISPIILIIAVAALVAALAFRDAVPNLLAGLELTATQLVKVGDFVKLETGEEGYIVQLSWDNTSIRALDGSTVVIPNSRLVRHTVTNYGRPLKKARDTFRFYSRTHLTELTGLKARNLVELRDVLKGVPDSVVYYHTHNFVEEHHFLTPEPSNDFAFWVSDALGDEVLAERLTSISTIDFPSLAALKESLVGIIEESLAVKPELRQAMEGREFYFMKSVGIIMPTPYVASDLREFVESLKKISLGSLYFHLFESRLRLGWGVNDFSRWLKDSLDEPELAAEIDRLNPYTYTLEGLRSTLIQLIEKSLK